MLITPNFSLHELTVSQTATRRGIENVPSQEVIDNLTQLCIHVLEPLRALLGRPILVSSGYRSPLLNQAIGGRDTSQHVTGQAADIHSNFLTPEELYQFIKQSKLPTDQVIQEFGNVGWVHVSFNSAGNRGQFLRATKDQDGDTVYTPDP